MAESLLIVGEGPLADTAAAIAGCQSAFTATMRAANSVEAQPLLSSATIVLSCIEQVGRHRARLQEGNVTQPTSLASMARDFGVRRFVSLGSIAVFGDAAVIGPETPQVPRTHYAISRAAGEAALLALDGEDFAVLVVRLPFIFDAERPGAMGNLVRLITTFKVIPVSIGDVPIARTMITYRAAARAILDLALHGRRGAVSIGDPAPLSFVDLAESISKTTGVRVVPLSIPRSCATVIRTLMPGVARRLLSSSIVLDSANAIQTVDDDVGSQTQRLISGLRRARL